MINHRNVFFGMVGILLLSFIFSIFGTYEINNIFNSKSGNLASQQAKISTLNSEQLTLLNAKAELKKYASLYGIAQNVVPQNKDQTQTVRQIIAIASANNVSIGSISFPSSTLGSITSSSSVTPSATSALNPNLSQLVRVPTIPGLYTLPITITSSNQANQYTSYNEFIGFLQGLENNRQTAQVTSLLITPNSQNPNYVNFNISLNIYIKPGN